MFGKGKEFKFKIFKFIFHKILKILKIYLKNILIMLWKYINTEMICSTYFLKLYVQTVKFLSSQKCNLFSYSYEGNILNKNKSLLH